MDCLNVSSVPLFSSYSMSAQSGKLSGSQYRERKWKIRCMPRIETVDAVCISKIFSCLLAEQSERTCRSCWKYSIIIQVNKGVVCATSSTTEYCTVRPNIDYSTSPQIVKNTTEITSGKVTSVMTSWLVGDVIYKFRGYSITVKEDKDILQTSKWDDFTRRNALKSICFNPVQPNHIKCK